MLHNMFEFWTALFHARFNAWLGGGRVADLGEESREKTFVEIAFWTQTRANVDAVWPNMAYCVAHIVWAETAG